MANKIMFGADLIKVLEKEYKLNKLGEVPTKYKNGITTIDFIYGKEKDIDDLKYNKPYIEFSIDDETDGFISGTMYLNGGVEGIQFDSYDDLKYFMKNAKWTESKKSARKSMKESKIDFQAVIDKVIPKEYAKNKNAYKYALSCVESLYNEDEYDSDSAKVYFLNCYISDSFPSWIDELGEEEMDALANALYDGTMKWSDIDSSWLE